jgi:hypothetical protein
LGPQELPAKNALITGDADLVGAAFRDKLATLDASTGMEPTDEPSFEAATGEVALTANEPFLSPVESRPFDPLLSKPNVGRRRVPAKAIRLRDKDHCKFVRTQPCVVCGPTPTEARHIGCAQPVLSAERSAMNTRSLSAGSVIATSMATATRPHGGPGSTSIPCRSRSSFGGDRD